MRDLLEAHGAKVYELPLIATEPPEDEGPLNEAVRQLHSYDWIAFSSQNAVEAIFDRLSSLGLPACFPVKLKVAALGSATAAELAARQVAVACQAEKMTARELAKQMSTLGVANQRILLPQANLARPDLCEGLEEAGARVESVVAYRTVQPAEIDVSVLDVLRDGKVDAVAFASPSAVQNLTKVLDSDTSCLKHLWLACIGPTTANQVKELGFEPSAVAAEHTSQGLVQALASMGPRHGSGRCSRFPGMHV